MESRIGKIVVGGLRKMRKFVALVSLSFLVMFSSLFTNTSSTEAAGNSRLLITEAKKLIGTPYRYGGTTPKGFDCSGFVYYTHKKIGKILPRTSKQMYQKGKAVHKSNLRAGDLVFFNTSKTKTGVSHVAIYIGNNQIIHATSSKGVKIDSLNNSYWKSKYVGAKRL
jgi:cell wall-associated NlpC family hydrolase